MKIYYFSGRGRPSRFLNSNGTEVNYPHNINQGYNPLFANAKRNYIIQHTNGKKYIQHPPRPVRPIPDQFMKPGVRGYGQLYEMELEPVSNNTKVSGIEKFLNNWAKRNVNENARKRVNGNLYSVFKKYKSNMTNMRAFSNNPPNNARAAHNYKWKKGVMNTWFKSNNAKKGPPKPLYRGVTQINFVNRNKNKGTFKNKSYSSWTTNLKTAKGFATMHENTGYIMKLNNTNKRPYVTFNSSRPTFSTNKNGEHEIILAPDTFHVTIINVPYNKE